MAYRDEHNDILWIFLCEGIAYGPFTQEEKDDEEAETMIGEDGHYIPLCEPLNTKEYEASERELADERQSLYQRSDEGDLGKHISDFFNTAPRDTGEFN